LQSVRLTNGARGKSEMICNCCGRDDDCRMGICFDCATAAEIRASKRSVLQHVGKALGHLRRGDFTFARISLAWAWERLTKTGDYAPGGEFEGYRGRS